MGGELTSADLEAKRAQVSAQYRAVAYLAQIITEVHLDQVDITAAGKVDKLLTMRGVRSHRLMNELGDILNGLDGVEDDDDWVAEVFDTARAMFPLSLGEVNHD
jgi:hypothetical protein